MLRIHDLASNFVQNKQSSRSPFKSETVITLIFSLLVMVFSIPLILLFPTIATYLSRLSFEWSHVSYALKIIPFILLSAVLGVIIFYLVRLVRVTIQLFQSFWASIEEED